MLHAVRPVPVQLRLHDHALLSLDLILEQSGITHRDLLIPPFCACSLLALKRIEGCDGDVQIRQCEINRRVAHILSHVHIRTQRHTNTGETRLEGD